MQASTSIKHDSFVGEPMGDKPVTKLAGIGVTCGRRMKQAGFDKAYMVLGKFLLFKKDSVLFTNWLRTTFRVPAWWANDCYECLEEWCANNL